MIQLIEERQELRDKYLLGLFRILKSQQLGKKEVARKEVEIRLRQPLLIILQADLLSRKRISQYR